MPPSFGRRSENILIELTIWVEYKTYKRKRLIIVFFNGTQVMCNQSYICWIPLRWTRKINQLVKSEPEIQNRRERGWWTDVIGWELVILVLGWVDGHLELDGQHKAPPSRDGQVGYYWDHGESKGIMEWRQTPTKTQRRHLLLYTIATAKHQWYDEVSDLMFNAVAMC